MAKLKFTEKVQKKFGSFNYFLYLCNRKRNQHDNIMKKKLTEINAWFKTLDSLDLSYIFSSLYEEIMESADPGRCTINHFLKEVKADWKEMTLEQKEKIYNEYKDI